MARLTKEQRRELANIRDEGESDIVAAIRDLAACILRLDEEVEPVHPSHLTTVVEHLERERDEALARLASAERALSALRLAYSREADALAGAMDERDELRDVRDELWAKLENACSERDGARAKLSDVDRLLAIEEQAKRVVRAEKWHEWAYDAWAHDHVHGGVVYEAFYAFKDERRKLAEMVGEGDES